ncbi:MAG TPA: hypothetical protein VGD96_06445 [Bradyrhizobium sp.]
MSEQLPQPTSAETGSASAASDAKTDFNTEPVIAESPTIAPDQEMTLPEADAPKVEPEVEAPKIETPKVEAPKVEVKAEKPRPSGNVVIMPPGERVSPGAAQPGTEAAPRRRIGAMAAVVALAAVAGAIGGALATAGLGQSNAGDAATARNVGLEAAVARIDADILALKASVEQNVRFSVTQLNKTSDRLEKVEKAQAEPATKLAKLSDEVSKLRATQAAAAAAPAQPAAASAAQKDVTGSVAPPSAAASPTLAANAKVEVGRLPTVEGWVLREVGRGSALIESRRGLYEVFAGDPIPGLGRVDAIRKQDGRWVVVTSKGLIVER